MFLGYKNS